MSLLAHCAVLLGASALAQEPLADVATPAWTVQVDPLTAALGFAHVQVERRLTPSWSVYAGPHLRLYDGILTPEPEPYTGVGAELGVRWYANGTALRGSWLLVRGVGARLSSSEATPRSGVGGYASALGGRTWILGEWLVLSGGLGVNRLFYTIGDYGISGWAPAAHTAVGVAL